MVMKKIDLAYLAGVVDSDGSITIAVDSWRTRNVNGRSPSYQELVIIGQCDPQPCELAHELFGGNIRFEGARGAKRRSMNYWQATNRKAVVVVKALLPYLRIKKPQAEIVLALRAIKERGRLANTYLDDEPIIVKTQWGPRPRRFRRTRPEVIAEMQSLAARIREFNDTRAPLKLP